MNDCRHPEISVELVGQDGNAFAILGRVTKAMQAAGISKAERDEFRTEATSGDYNHLLQTVMEWVTVDETEEEEDEEWEDWDDNSEPKGRRVG